MKVPGTWETDSDKPGGTCLVVDFLIWCSNRDVKDERIFGPNSDSFWISCTDPSPPPWVHVGEMQHPNQVPL